MQIAKVKLYHHRKSGMFVGNSPKLNTTFFLSLIEKSLYWKHNYPVQISLLKYDDELIGIYKPFLIEIENYIEYYILNIYKYY